MEAVEKRRQKLSTGTYTIKITMEISKFFAFQNFVTKTHEKFSTFCFFFFNNGAGRLTD